MSEIDFKKLGEYALEAFKEEYEYLCKHNVPGTNLRGEGLPGRREEHFAMVLARHLFTQYGVRSLVSDGYWSDYNLKCDLVIEKKPGAITKKVFFLEMKIVPSDCAIKQFSKVLLDLRKLQSTESEPEDFPQGIMIIGLDQAGRLKARINEFAEFHGLNRWPLKIGNGMHCMDLKPGQGYQRLVIGFWGRTSRDQALQNLDRVFP